MFSIWCDSGCCLNPICVLAGSWSGWVRTAGSDQPCVGCGFILIPVSFSKPCAIWLYSAEATKWPVWAMGSSPPHRSGLKYKVHYWEPDLCMCGSGVAKHSWTALWGHLAKILPLHGLASIFQVAGIPFVTHQPTLHSFALLRHALPTTAPVGRGWEGSSSVRTERERKKRVCSTLLGHSSSVQRRRFFSLRILGACGLGCKRMEKTKKGELASALPECEQTLVFFLKPELEGSSWGSCCLRWWCSLLGLDCLETKQGGCWR